MRRNRRDGEEEYGRSHRVRFRRIKFLGIVVIIAVTGVAGIKAGAKWQQDKITKENHEQEITSDVLQQEMQQIGELATVKYFYTNMVRFEDSKTFLDYNIPLTTKAFTISYDGIIRAGVDLEDIAFFISDDKVITISIPEATVISHDLDMDSVTVYDEKSSIFNELKTEDITELLSDQEDTMEEKAINNGILDEANDNAKSTLSSIFTEFINSGEFEDGYSIEIETGAE